MIEFQQLEQFIAVAEEGNLSKASEKLLISQPALTRSIQRLEEDLGLSLFDRTKNRITLNDNGHLAEELMRKLPTQRDQMIQTLQAYNNSKYVIHIGSCAPVPVWGLEYIFKNATPNLNVTHVLDSNEKYLIEKLKSKECSIIVLTHPIRDDSLECVELFEEYLYISVPPAHPLALFNEVSFKDLDGESVLLFSDIGFWNEICVKKIPQSHLLIQQDQSVFNELSKASALPTFKSNITRLDGKKEENRIDIPISDKEAHVNYFAVFDKENKERYHFIEKMIKKLNWKEILNNTI